MNTTIKEMYFNWVDFYSESDNFCPCSDAGAQCANYICKLKPNWNFERAFKFVTNLITR